MKHTRAALFAGLTLTAASVGAFVPAHAAEDTTTATFEVQAAGGLAISAPTTADLGRYDSGSLLVSGQLGTVTVTDQRGELDGSWAATAAATDFIYKGPDGIANASQDVSRTSATYVTGLIDETGLSLGVTAGVGGSLGAVVPAAARVGVGNSSGSWNPRIDVVLGAQAPVGTYTSTITHSVS